MSNVKTIALTGAETEINFEQNYMCFWVHNLGSGTIYASDKPQIVPDDDGVISIPSGSSARVSNPNLTQISKLYLFGNGKVQIVGSYSVHCPFKTAAEGGGGSGGVGTKNLFNFQLWGSSLDSPPISGMQTIDYNEKSITLTATDHDCFTRPYVSSVSYTYRLPVTPGDNYTLSWEAESDKEDLNGSVIVFYNGESSKQATTSAMNKKLSFTVPYDATFITLRLSVLNPGNTIKYSSIELHDNDVTIDAFGEYLNDVQNQVDSLTSRLIAVENTINDLITR